MWPWTIGQKHMTFFNLTGEVSNVREAAEWHNRLQRFALDTRLGIPVTLSTDPRRAFTLNLGTGALAGGFSQWPESLGLAALRDPKWTRKFAEAVREEYMAIGIRCALHPQVDLATEYRWARNCNSMGEDNPFVGVDAAEKSVGRAELMRLGLEGCCGPIDEQGGDFAVGAEVQESLHGGVRWRSARVLRPPSGWVTFRS
ncbi:unnamed protein product [Clonostachys rhizophaga]|uniref:beta-glucosidase n=1 Tax=Clonostachys rhizophaga TaxID=160324 RepID=A0A9N9YG80_9HYPO|nr:unnamed protein product [Clonostachys rhizophaga]